MIVDCAGLAWLGLAPTWGGTKGGTRKEDYGFTTFKVLGPSDETTESQEEVQVAVRCLRESGNGSAARLAHSLRMSYSGTFLVVYLAESVSGGSSVEVGVTQHFGPSPSMRVSGRGG